MYILDNYQDCFISDIGAACKEHKSVLAQLCTGGGKTVVFAAISYRYLQKSKKDVIIFVDSDDILDQTRKTILDWYGLDCTVINKNSNGVKLSGLFNSKCPRITISMVETFDRRSSRKSFLEQTKDVGLVIVDECHMGNFYKIFEHFPFSLRIGFTATPLNADKKKPLKNYYETIVVGPPTQELIELNKSIRHRGVVRDISYALTGNIDRSAIEQEQQQRGYTGLDFDDKLTGDKLSGTRQIQNTINAYIRHSPGKKALCFNANVSHSILVTQEMVKSGLNARHMDSSCSEQYKAECKKWLKETPNAILCNVGMTTKGFDEKSIEVVILNRLTKSLPLYNQMCGRGSRPFKYPDGTYKDYFIVLDMCDNILGGGHGQWSDPIDWKYLFENPKMPKAGVAPCKQCPECDYICPASARVCPGKIEDPFSSDGSWIDCGYQFEVKVAVEDITERKMVLISKNIDVSKIINHPKFIGKEDYFTFYQTIRACAWAVRENSQEELIDRDEFESIWSQTYLKIKEWQVLFGKQKNENGNKMRDNPWYTSQGRDKLVQYLREYKFVVNLIPNQETEEIDA